MEGKARRISPFLFFFSFTLFVSLSSSLQSQSLTLTTLPSPPQSLSWSDADDEASDPFTSSDLAAEFTTSVQLHHVDALSSNSTPQQLFNSRLIRDASRVEKIESVSAAAAAGGSGGAGFSSSVISGLAQGSGEYFTRLGVGTPPRYVYMVLDTGSDIADPVFDPRKSSSYAGIPCAAPLCRRLDSPGCNSKKQTCLYQVSYGDGSFTTGEFSTETLTFRKTRVARVAVGCGHDNEGLFVGAAGLLGLGKGKLSFPAQTGRRFNRKFSYCLVDRSASAKPSSMAFRVGASNLKRAADFSLFDTCFDLSGKTEVKVPTVVLHFRGADVSLPASNYLIPVDTSGTFCFAFAGTMSGLSIIGNIQQQGFRVVYDLGGSRVGFAPRGCA
ncbi:Aspartyl protease family protein 2 [Linum grandiflorum]